MKITVFGGSGEQTTGSHVVRQALEKGYTVTCLVRNPDRFAVPQTDNLTLIQGDVMNQDDVDKCISNDTEAVIVSLGTTPMSKQPTGKSAMPPNRIGAIVVPNFKAVVIFIC